jgi:hypothetical protein
MAQDQPDIRSQLLRSLMRKLANDPYPSTTMMDTVEELLTSDSVDDYAKILLDHIDDDRFPSIAMIDRVRNLAVG